MDRSPHELDWYVLTVSPLCERAVASRLKRLFGGTRGADGSIEAPAGVATWVALAKREVRRRGTRYTVERNVLPRYVFFGWGRDAVPWYDVRGVLGVHGVLGVDGQPARIAGETVGSLIFRVDRGDYHLSAPPAVKRWMRVVAERGMFRGHEGEVATIDRERGVAGVLFDLLGAMPIEMNLDDLVSVSYASQRMIG